MINFFRKTRKKMADDNKPMKYMRYAIGEIALVMIGILLALQVNTWNEVKKNKKKMTTLLIDYREDLVQDTLMLSDHISYNESAIESGQKNMNRISGPNATFDTVKHIAKYEHNPFISIVDKYNSKSTFNSMIGTSAFKLLDQELKRRILNLDVGQTMTLNEKMIDAYFDLTNEFTLHYPFGNNLGSGYLNEISWNIQNERDFAVKYSAMCSFKILLMNNKKNNYEKTLLQTKELISELDQYKN
jgi:hypothetical protein